MKLYCGTYAKYNEGSLYGKWLDLDDYEGPEEFLQACLELHKDEADPELMFQDYEAEEDWESSLYGESSMPSEYWEIKEALESSNINGEILAAYIDCFGGEVSAETIENAQDHYRGEYSSGAEMLEEEAEECGDLETVPEPYRNYIDWEAMYRSAECGGGYRESNGHYFWC